MGELVKKEESIRDLIVKNDQLDFVNIAALRGEIRSLPIEAREYILMSEPNKKWVKKHPLIKVKRNNEKVPLEYIPIDKIETLLDLLYPLKSIEVISVNQFFNAIAVTVRVKVFDPTLNNGKGDWIVNDGVGAVEVQTESGYSPADMAKIVSGAVQKALPAAKSYAIKDACDHLGSIFGRNIGREEAIYASGIMKAEERVISEKEKSEKTAQLNFIADATSVEMLKTLEDHLLESVKEIYELKLKSLQK